MEEPLSRLSIYPIVSFPNVNPGLFIIKQPGVNKGFTKLYIGNIILIKLPLGTKQEGRSHYRHSRSGFYAYSLLAQASLTTREVG